MLAQNVILFEPFLNKKGPGWFSDAKIIVSTSTSGKKTEFAVSCFSTFFCHTIVEWMLVMLDSVAMSFLSNKVG